ncbi:MAG: ChaN family lipoprotein [Cyanobacteriota bacterium]|nr:ChaN family lipoprotein [Cyanobacteriota bacterium]
MGSMLALGARAMPPSPRCAEAVAEMEQQQRQLLEASPRLESVLLGEIHTSAADHTWQLGSLETLAQGRRPLVLALEMVPASRQPILTRFATGQLEEQAFLREVDWAGVWGHEPALYLPLLRWARQKQVPLLALNVEQDVVRRVRREGLAAIPAPEREGIGTPAPAGEAYRQRLRGAWQAHRTMGLGEGKALPKAEAEDLERFIGSQLLRDQAMAERIAAAHRRDPARLVVALIGLGHMEGGDGVPNQLRHLGLNRILTLQRPELPEGCGPPPPGARLGAYLESVDGAVWVRQVAPGSAAEAGGLKPGDRVRAVNGEPVERAGQVIRRVRELPQGEPLRLRIERGGRQLLLEMRLPSAPSRPPGRMEAKPPLAGLPSP